MAYGNGATGAAGSQAASGGLQHSATGSVIAGSVIGGAARIAQVISSARKASFMASRAGMSVGTLARVIASLA